MPLLPAKFADTLPWFKPSAPANVIHVSTPVAKRYAGSVDRAAGESVSHITHFEITEDGEFHMWGDITVSGQLSFGEPEHWQAFAIAAGAHEGGDA